MKYTYLTILFFFAMAVVVQAQQIGLHFTPGLWQSSRTNPAFLNNKKFSFGLPSPYLHVANGGPGYNDLVIRSENGERLIDAKATFASFSKNNIMRAGSELETFHVAFGKKMQFSLYHSIKVRNELNYPRELAGLVLLGNAPYIGQKIDIAPDFLSMSYNELGLGVAFKLGNLSLGGRLKYLSGMHHIGTDRSLLTFRTDDEIYQITASADYSIRAAGLVDIQTADQFADWMIDLNDISFGGNNGIALDLGFQLDVNDKLSLAASVLDIGGIQWKTNGHEFATSGSYSFDGIDVLPFLEGENFTFDNIIDTLQSIFNVEEQSITYGTMLPMKTYFSTTYRLNHLVRLNGLLYSEFLGAKSMVLGSVGANLDVGKILSFGLNYSLSTDGFHSIGSNMLLSLGPIQLYAMTDNLLAAMHPFNSGAANVRLGLNVAINGKD